jgi:c-di-GMP-binding flagellar brake protein YcgR
MTSPFPEPDSPELAAFVVRSRVEIVSALRRLRDQRVPVTLFHGEEGRFAVAMVLDVHAGTDEVIVECAADSAARGDLAVASSFVVVGFLENVKIQFTVRSAELVVPNGSMFRLPLPRQMLRLQRRAFLRVKPRAVVCHVPRAVGSMHYYAFRVADLGVGGCSLRVRGTGPAFELGQLIERCQLELSDVARIDIVLRVRHLERIESDVEELRVGCAFEGLEGAARKTLQKYIDQAGLALRQAPARRPG